jgi:Flp pilus assembly protein TadD/TolB-like protein
VSLYLAVVVLLLITAPACRREPRIQRIAILRFENLGSNSAADWMGRAFAEVITDELSGAPGIYAISTGRLQSAEKNLGARPAGTPGISSQRTAALTVGANRLGYGQFSIDSGRLSATLTIENPATGKIVARYSAGAQDVISTADSLARQVSSMVTKYGTSNPAALEGYVTALEAGDPEIANSHLKTAIAADSNFLLSYRYLAELKARQGERAAAMSILEIALARGQSVAPADRAFLEGQVAELRGDRAAVERSLTTLSKLRPDDAAVWRSLAETAMARRNYQLAVEAFPKALEIEPENPSAWNQYGYCAAHQGDFAGAMRALRRYQTMRPAEPNPLDSQGDVNVLYGRFREAETLYLEAAKKDANFLNGVLPFKAAMARLMSGDVAGADGLAKQYFDARAAAKDPLVEYRKAEWAWASGRRKEACQQLEVFAHSNQDGPLRDLAARSYGTLSVWSLLLGYREAALSLADRAISLASANTAAQAHVARFLAQPPATAAEWSGRADRVFSNPAAQLIKDYATAYALLLSGQFEPASTPLKRLQSGGAGGEANLDILLAWTLVETGNLKEAEPILRWNPLPPSNGVGAFFSFWFPRIYYLRGVAAEKAGKVDEARKNYQLFQQLSGPDPLIWGEEKKAAK